MEIPVDRAALLGALLLAVLLQMYYFVRSSTDRNTENIRWEDMILTDIIASSFNVTTSTSSATTNSGSTSTASSSTNDNDNAMILGKNDNRKYKLVVGGITRDNAKFLDGFRKTLLRVLNETSEIFDLERVVIYENDSRDKTASIIKSWNNDEEDTVLGGKVELISEKLKDVAKHTDIYAGRNAKGRLKSGRTCRTAYARNRVLQRIREVDKRTPVDYFLNLDMDEVNVNLKGLETCFDMDEDNSWGACCANPYEIYYDLWVLRSSPRRDLNVSKKSKLRTAADYEAWLQCDIWADCTMPGWERAFRHIPANQPPIKVHSCFGGAALYDFKYLRTGGAKYTGAYTPRYGPFYDGKETVEHFMLHDELHRIWNGTGGTNNKKFTLYIQPKFLHDGGQAHTKKSTHPDEVAAVKASHEDPTLRPYYVRPDTGGGGRPPRRR